MTDTTMSDLLFLPIDADGATGQPFGRVVDDQRRMGIALQGMIAQERGIVLQVLEQVLEEATVPRTHPSSMDLKSDRAGRLWVRLPADGPSTTWMILTPQGEHIASLALPSSVEPLDVGSQDLIAVERDDLGVQRILWYTLPAPFPPSPRAEGAVRAIASGRPQHLVNRPGFAGDSDPCHQLDLGEDRQGKSMAGCATVRVG